jgi:hypothetical protein
MMRRQVAFGATLWLNKDVSEKVNEGQEVLGLVAFPLAIGGYPQ